MRRVMAAWLCVAIRQRQHPHALARAARNRTCQRIGVLGMLTALGIPRCPPTRVRARRHAVIEAI